MYSVLNTFSEYRYFYMSKNITSYTFLLVFKIFESLPYILNESLVAFQNEVMKVIKTTKIFVRAINETNNSRTDQVKFVEDTL